MTGQRNCRCMIEHLPQNPTATLVSAIFLVSCLATGIPSSGSQVTAYADPPPLPPIPMMDQGVEDRTAKADSQTGRLPPSPVETEQKALIEKALRGESVDAPDNMLGDIVEMIQRRGSLLDGSELGKDMPRMDSDSGKTDVDQGPTGSQADRSVQTDPQRISRNLIAAEQLVRAARLLLETAPGDESTRQLVNQMRVRAVKLIQPRQ